MRMHLMLAFAGALTGIVSPLTSVARPPAAALQPLRGPASFAGARRRSWIDATAKPAVYVANVSTETVDIFSTRGKLMGQLAPGGQPWAITVDEHGNVYVAVWVNVPFFNVVVYPPGATTPSRTLPDNDGAPMGIAVKPDGTIVVANYYTCGSVNCELPGDVIAYPPSSRGTFVKYASGIVHPYYVTAADDGIYVEGYDVPHTVLFGEYASRTKFTKIGIPFNGYFTGTAVDRNDDVAIYQHASGTVDVYPPQGTTPIRSFPLTGVTPDGGVALALSRDDRVLYALGSHSGAAFVARFDYATGLPIGKPFADQGYCFGIAVDPRANP